MKTAFIIAALCSFLLPAAVFAAGEEYEEVIYLKNGSVIHGTIIEQVPGVSYKIKTKSGDIFVFKAAEVEKIAKEAVAPAPAAVVTEAKPAAPRAAGGYLRKGFSGFTNTGYYIAIHDTVDPEYGDFDGSVIPFGSSFGYSIGSAFFGLGVAYIAGFDDYDEYASVYYETRYFFSPRSNLSPCMSVVVGPHFLSGAVGVMAGVGAGVDYRLSNNYGAYAEAGYLGLLPQLGWWAGGYSYWVGNVGARFGVAATF